MRETGSTAAAAFIPTPEDVVELGGRDGAGAAAIEAEVNRDHRIESTTAAVEISNDADGNLIQWLTIEATADARRPATTLAANWWTTSPGLRC
jgi:hypothetical protein